MAYTKFENNKTKANDVTFNEMQRELIKIVFPIGSTYTTQEDVNPFEILKFGTWERVKGKVLLGLDEEDKELNETGKTGGVKEIELRATAGAYDEDIYKFAYKKAGAINKIEHNMCGFQEMGSIYSGDIGNMNHNIPVLDVAQKTEKTKIMQPYEVVGYMWIRRT